MTARAWRRWLPAPLLSAALLALWLTLNNTLAAGHLVLGLALAVGVPLVAGRWREAVLPLGGDAAEGPGPAAGRRRRAGRRVTVALRLLVRVLGDIVSANLAVARRIAFVPERRLAAGFVVFDLRLRTPGATGALAAIITLTPGTVSTDILPPESPGGPARLLVHGFDMPDPEATVAAIRLRYEAPLMEIFE
jgi:multicomponent K+:H+ antiporter subunit E